MEKHCDLCDIESYLNGKMGLCRRFFCRRHLKKCPACRKLLASVQADNQLTAKLKETLERIQTSTGKHNLY